MVLTFPSSLLLLALNPAKLVLSLAVVLLPYVVLLSICHLALLHFKKVLLG